MVVEAEGESAVRGGGGGRECSGGGGRECSGGVESCALVPGGIPI